VNKEKEKDG
jgi:hypothetical protein